MKDNSRFIKLAFTITWILLFVLAGIVVYKLVKDENRQPNVNNYIGKSAYQLAAEHGFKGSETQWLDSLKAVPPTPIQPDKPVNGKDSVSTHTIVEHQVSEKTIVEKQTEIPVPGPKGDKGDTPKLAQDRETGLIYWKIDGDDDWQLLPKLCLGALCN